MTSTTATTRVYEDIELPTSAEWVHEDGHDTLIVNLQGYKKENLRIQVTSTRNIRVLGERLVRPENNTWQRFRKEFPVSSNCDVNESTARFENGFLYVKIPETIAPVKTAASNKDQKPQKPATPRTAPTPPPPPPTVAIPKPQKPTSSTTPYVPQMDHAAAASAQQNNLSNAAQRTNAAAAQEKKPPSETNGSSSKFNSGIPQANYASNAETTAEPNVSMKEKTSAAITTDRPGEMKNKSTTTAFEGAAVNGDSKKASMEKEKSDVISANAENVENKSPVTEDVNRGKRVKEEYDSAKEDAKTEEYCSTRTQGPGYYRQIVDGLIMELKEPKKMVNLAVGLVFVLVVSLYVKYAINSLEEFRQEL